MSGYLTGTTAYFDQKSGYNTRTTDYIFKSACYITRIESEINAFYIVFA